MRIKFITFLVMLFLTIGATPLSAQLKKIRFSTTGISISELPFKVAHVKGFYREEGLDVETILIRGAVGMQALLGGSVDYTSASGSTIAAAVRGLPVKLVLFLRPSLSSNCLPAQIKSVIELKGKVVGISSRGGSNDLMMQMILQKNGLAPNKDCHNADRRSPGRIRYRAANRTYRSGPLTPPRNFCFNAMASTASLIPAIIIHLCERRHRRHRQKIKTNPAEVLGYVKGNHQRLSSFPCKTAPRW